MKLEDVAKNYDQASQWYDLFTKSLLDWLLGLGKYRERILNRLGELNNARVLEIGCGTGLNFKHILARIKPDGELVGLDYSSGMLEKARQKIETNDWKGVTLVKDDAAKLEHLQGSFDAIVAYWCYGIVHDLDDALERALEILSPGGRIAILDFQRTKPENQWLRLLYPLYRWLLIAAKIDSPEDLNDEHIQNKWKKARSLLRSRLKNYHEESYLFGMGVLISGELVSHHETAKRALSPQQD
jgi:ubiquinone/menaquinone biosynthesis C-methylase UbiE